MISAYSTRPRMHGLPMAKQIRVSEPSEDTGRVAAITSNAKPTIRSLILELMADNRERTANDIANRLTRHKTGAVKQAISRMVESRELSKTLLGRDGNLPIYRIIQEAKA